MTQIRMTRRELLRCGAAVLAGAASQPLAPKRAAAATPAATTGPAVAKPVTLTYWWWSDNATQAQFYRDTVDKFNQSQKTIRVVQESQTSVLTIREKLAATAAAGTGGPDITQVDSQWANESFMAGYLRPLTDFFDKWDRKNDLLPKMQDQARYYKDDRPLMYLPWALQMTMHFYRTDVFKAAGLAAPDTLDDMFKAAATLNKPPDRYGYGLRAGDGVGVMLNVMAYMGSEGVTFTDGKGNSDLDGPVAVGVAKRVAQLYYDGVAQPSALQDRFPQLVALIQAGKIAQNTGMSTHGSMLKGEKNQYESVIGIAPIPKGNGPNKKRFAHTIMTGNGILKACKEPEAAWEFLSAITQPEGVENFCKAWFFTSAWKSALSRPFFAENRYAKLASDTEPEWASFPRWHKNFVAMYADVAPMLWQRVLKKEITVEVMLKQMADMMRQV